MMMKVMMITMIMIIMAFPLSRLPNDSDDDDDADSDGDDDDVILDKWQFRATLWSGET